MSASLYINIASHHTIQIWNAKNITVDEVQAMVDDVIACNYSIAGAPARSSEKVIVSVDVNIARNTLPWWCVIMLGPSNQICYPVSMISVTLWSITHKRSTYANIIFLLAASLAGPVDNVRLSDLTGALETVLIIMLFCARPRLARPHSTIGNQL